MSDDEVFHFNINDIVEKGIVSTLYPVFTTDENLDSRYLQYQLNYGHEFAKFAILQKQGGSRTYMYLNKLRQLHLTMPNHVEEQKAISSFFMNLDHLITLHQRKFDKLQVLKKAMLEKMFPKNGSSVPEIRFKGFTDAWERRKLADVVDSVDTGKSKFDKEGSSGEYPILGSTSVIGYDDEYDYEGDFILTARVGANAGSLYRHAGKAKISDNTVFIQASQNIEFLYQLLIQFDIKKLSFGTGQPLVKASELKSLELMMPTDMREQMQIGEYFKFLDNLITLHQRKPYSHIQRRCNMLNEAQSTDKFCEYYAKWITVYKKGAIRQVTMDKYLMTQKWLEKLIPDLKICDLNRIAYQQLLNDYAEYHERQTTMDFHHQLKGAVLDAVDEGLIDRDPTRKAIIKGKAPSAKKIKYLNQFELHTLLASLELKDEVNWDYFILLVAKNGMRFSEALALTPKDFDFYHQTLSISKTWDYKGAGGFQPTKNKSSVRKIQIDWQSVIRFSELVKGLPEDQPIFVDGKVYNSTVNDVLSRHCERCNIPVISIHGLRHTHASLLLFTGVSIASVARRLGHSSMTTTQKTYLHIIQELENKDIDLVMRSLSGLN